VTLAAVYRRSMRLQPVLRAMTRRGLRVNDTLRQERIALLSAEADKLQEQAQNVLSEDVWDRLERPDLFYEEKVCKDCHNGRKKRLTCGLCGGQGKAYVTHLNLGSERQLKDLLYNGLGLPERTTNGKVTTDEEALQSLVALDTTGLVRLALRYGKLDTQRSIYERIAPAPDGHVRTVFNAAGTYTGRLAAAGAFYVAFSTNLHNLSASEAARDPLFAVRDCIVPDPGEAFIYADLCVGGHTRILKTDLTWEIAERIKIGDEVIAFDEHGSQRKYRRASVIDNTPLIRKCVRVVTDKGSVVCSREHLWLVKRGRQTRKWVQASELQPDDQLPWLGFPWDVENSYDAGWLAGLFDGEGHLCDTAVGFTQKEGKGVWERGIALLQDRGFALSIDRNSRGIPRANLRGLYCNLRFLGQIRPKRLLATRESIWEGRKIWGSRTKPAMVLGIEDVGEQRVYPISTTARTFVAEGLLTHNSQAEARVSACLSEDYELLERWKDPKWDCHRWTASAIFSKPEAAITAEERYLGKRCRHALNYGMGPNKFWRVINADADVTGIAITLSEAKRIHAAYHSLHPNLDNVWWNRVQRTIEEHGTLETVFGRRCNFYPRLDPDTGQLDLETLRAAIAFEPQSTVADLKNEALLAAFAAEGGVYRCLHEAHDAILVGCRKNAVLGTARILKRCLERPLTINAIALTIPAECFVGAASWSQLTRLF